MKFKVGEEYSTANGAIVRVLVDNSPVFYSGKSCPLVCAIRIKGATDFSAIYPYTEDGIYCGTIGATYDHLKLISNEPTVEELDLVKTMTNLCRGDYSDGEKDKQLLKVIRALRKN